MVTQKKIAETLNIGRSTVSNILRGDKTQRYDDKTRKLVLETAEQLGYRPNRAAQIIRMGRSNLIGVIHFGSGTEVAKNVAHHLPDAVSKHGYEVFVADLSWHAGSYSRVVEKLVEARVEGVVISHMTESFTSKDVNVLRRAGIPVATLAGNEKLGVPIVASTSEEPVCEMVEHLAGLGHRKMLQLVKAYDSRPMLGRIRGFNRGVSACGHVIPANSSEPVLDWLKRKSDRIEGRTVRLGAEQGISLDSAECAYRYLRDLIAQGGVPDVILCANDQWARGAFSAALEAGLSVPDDLAITGFDNESFGAYAPYYLTTAQQPIAEECEKMAEVIVDLIQGRPLDQQQFIFPSRLVKRRSCGDLSFDITNPVFNPFPL